MARLACGAVANAAEDSSTHAALLTRTNAMHYMVFLMRSRHLSVHREASRACGNLLTTLDAHKDFISEVSPIRRRFSKGGHAMVGGRGSLGSIFSARRGSSPEELPNQCIFNPFSVLLFYLQPVQCSTVLFAILFCVFLFFFCNLIRVLLLSLQSHLCSTAFFAIPFVFYCFLCNLICNLLLPSQSQLRFCFTIVVIASLAQSNEPPSLLSRHGPTMGCLVPKSVFSWGVFSS